MRHPVTSAVLLIFSLALTGAVKDKIYLTIGATSHSTTSQRIAPESADTNCFSSADGTTNCQTTFTPPRVRQVISNVVEANSQRYLITCRASWMGSNCTSMTDGDTFQAEIEGTTMWVHGRNGGNQGKGIRVKYKILDIRPVVN